MEGVHAATEDLRKSQYLEKSQSHILKQDDLRKSLHLETTLIENDINDRQKLATNKAVEVESLRRSYHDLNTELIRAEDDHQLADTESRVWKDKAAEADRIKQAEIDRANRLKEASI